MKRNVFLELLYPWKCPFCGRILRKKEGEICSECRLKLPYIKGNRCLKCGKLIDDERQEYCFDCREKEHYFNDGRSLWVHHGVVSKAIYEFKYHDMKCYAMMFGKEMAKEYKGYLESRNVELLIPIPLHPKRKRERGYNQAEILAKEISRYTNIPYKLNALKRKKSTNPQKKLDNKARKHNMRGAFEILESIEAKNVVLIDDIYTTGSTIDEAARVLKEAGVSNVFFLTISIGQGL